MKRLRRTAAGLAWALLLPHGVAVVLDALYFFGLQPRGFELSDQASSVVYGISGALFWIATISLAYLAIRGRLPGTGVPQPAGSGGGTGGRSS